MVQIFRSLFLWGSRPTERQKFASKKQIKNNRKIDKQNEKQKV